MSAVSLRTSFHLREQEIQTIISSTEAVKSQACTHNKSTYPVPNLSKLPSTASLKFFLELPAKLLPILSPYRVGLPNLVARTISSRLPRSAIHSPIQRSDSPNWYMLAVSMKFPPCWWKVSRMAKVVAFVHSPMKDDQALPKFMAPRQRGETRIAAVGERIRW
jgi:hypothetical protein